MELELASDVRGMAKQGKKGRKLVQPMGWKALWNGDGEGGWEGRKTEKNLQVIEKEMGKGGWRRKAEMEGTFVSRERSETRKQGPDSTKR